MSKSARFLFIFSLIFVISIFHYFTSFKDRVIMAAGNLQELSDVVASMVGDVANVGHTVSFTLPRNAAQVVPSDYIFINMAAHENIRANITVRGAYTGTPIATVSGQNVILTNLNILPGATVIIEGIVADNPDSEFQMKLVISITEDAEGNLIKNVGTVYSSKTSGQISVIATISPPYASVRFNGYSAPGTFVTFTENGTVIGTDTAGVAGLFSKYLTGITPGTHTFTIYGVDLASRTTSLMDTTAITPIYQETLISDLILSPTIEIDREEILQGDDLIASGSAIINGNLSIFTEPHLRTYYATASALGSWDYTLSNTQEYIPGDYHIYSQVHNGVGLQSNFSNALQFKVSSSISDGSAECDISRGDLSCDSSINLVDFSILMYYWGSTNAAADIVIDELVNLYDFSVMMYYWGT